MRKTDATTEKRPKKQKAPTFTLEILLPPGIDPSTARKLTERAVAAALAETGGMG